MREQRRPQLLIGLFNWLSMISAIMEREITTRFSGGSFGHAWAIIIPVSWVIAITLFFRWMGRDTPIPVSLPLFLATGMLPYLMFRQTITSMMRALRSNKHLITLGPAEPEDIFTAIALLELLNALLITTVVLSITLVWTGLPEIQSPLLALWGLTLACTLGMALGRLAAVLSLVSDSTMRLIPILLRPFFWLSGIFFIAAEVPRWALDWLWFNPLFHAIELMRSGFFADFTSDFAAPIVPITAILALYLTSRLIEAAIAQRPGTGVVPR